MKTDFLDAAKRHFQDAEHLHSEGRLPNADQLYGLAAECALKAIMLGLNIMTLDARGRPIDGRHQVHIDKLWGEFASAASGRQASKYASQLGSKNPFVDWGIYQRYWHSQHIEKSHVEDHRNGAHRAHAVLLQAEEDGLL